MNSGMVRRIDELGRIVIPKEIRRTLKIRDGEDVEIFVDNDVVILRKFSKVADLVEISNKFIDVVSNLIGKTVLIADRDVFVSGSGNLKKKFINKDMSRYNFKDVFDGNIHVEKNLCKVKFLNDVEENFAYIVNPIHCYGDIIGAVFIISANSDISDFDVIISDMIAQFLGKYVED